MIGHDTGFFLELLNGNQDAVVLWKEGINDEVDLVVSCLPLFEIERLGLKGAIRNANVILKSVNGMCKVVWLHHDLVSQGARLSHGLGVPAMDALILAFLISNNCSQIWTTDSHFEAYQSNKTRVKNLRKRE